MIVAIHQPNYLPWLGYFRKIALSDVFVFFDNVQMPTGKSFVSRNRILTARGPLWLTVPVERSGVPHRIAETRIADQFWPSKHLKTLETNYARSPWRSVIRDILAPVFTAEHQRIADLNVALIRAISAQLGLTGVRFLRASEMNLEGEGAATIPEILRHTDATAYVTSRGKGTQRHLDAEELEASGIAVKFLSTEFSPYPQRLPVFEANLSVVDALLSCGPERTRALLDEH